MFYNKNNFLIKDFCAKNSARPELNGVFCEPNRTTATDSFIMCSVSAPNCGSAESEYPVMPNKPKPLNNFKPFILPAEEAGKMAKVLSRKVSLPILENAVVLQVKPEFVEIGATDLQSVDGVFTRPIQGEYPAYQEIMQEKGGFIEVSVNPAYLEKVAKFFKEFCKDNRDGVLIKIPKDKDTPIRFYAQTANQKANALIMPIKS